MTSLLDLFDTQMAINPRWWRWGFDSNCYEASYGFLGLGQTGSRNRIANGLHVRLSFVQCGYNLWRDWRSNCGYGYFGHILQSPGVYVDAADLFLTILIKILVLVGFYVVSQVGLFLFQRVLHDYNIQIVIENLYQLITHFTLLESSLLITNLWGTLPALSLSRSFPRFRS